MRMYRCDRCGELVSSSYKGFIRKPYRGVYRFGKKAHLCPDCAEDLRKWMKGCQFADAGALREVVAGCKVKEICIERIIGFRGSLPVGDSFRINVELPEGYAMTLPITYCPMCGERLEGDWDDER